MCVNQTDKLIIHKAWEHNLKGIDLVIPKGKLVVFAGVSGSGKSSLVFNTIAAESMRQLQEIFPLYIRNRMAYQPKPNVESIENLTTAIVVDQRPFHGDERSTVGTMTEISPMLRMLFSRCSNHPAGLSNCYSPHDPAGMCTLCGGAGKLVQFTMDKVLDMSKSLNEGAILLPGFQVGTYQWQMYANSGMFDNDKALSEYTEKEWNDFLYASGSIVEIKNTTGKVWDSSYNLTYEGLEKRINRLYLKKSTSTMSKLNLKIIHNFTAQQACPHCHGTGLNEKARQSTIMGKTIWDIGEMEISSLIVLLKKFHHRDGQLVVNRIEAVLRNMDRVGLGYLHLNRQTVTLSGGEVQRLKIIRHLSSSLIGVTYIFDEPSTGLHAKDLERLRLLLAELRNRGNSVFVVEHNSSIINEADHIIEMGPKAGKAGGQVIFQGTAEALRCSDTPTGTWLRQVVHLKRQLRPLGETIVLSHCNEHNLKDINVTIPKNTLTVITGVSGSGKSSLAKYEIPKAVPGAVYISQSAIGLSSRSTPATYSGVWDMIRKIFAKENGVSPTLFSFNSQGACPVCKGKGIIEVEMSFMDPVIRRCEACNSKKYSAEALSYSYHGKTIDEILEMTVAEGIEFFKDTAIGRKLQPLADVGLPYLTLGQTTSSLSGGECQRLKLAARLHEKNQFYVMDEPSAGLHGKDVAVLIRLLNKLVDNGNTVLAVDHNFDIISQADWIIDMGPEGGKNGGHVVYQGRPQGIMQCPASYTGVYLAGQCKG